MATVNDDLPVLESAKTTTEGAARIAAVVARPRAAKPSAAGKTVDRASRLEPVLGAHAGVGAAALPRKRRNKRSEETITNILGATEQIVLKSGADRISILDVCKAAEVSRGTFYRYFSSQEELLDAFSRHKRESFHRALVAATEHFEHPDDRLNAVIEYLEHYLEHGRARRLLLVAPEYALGFFKRIFHDAVVRFEDALRPVFEAWDLQLSTKLDRELVCEMLIRYVMSELLVPGETDRRSLPRRLGRLVSSIAGAGVARGRR